jgi:lambda family phage portal protein
MSWLDTLARRFGYARIRRSTGFAAADSGRLTASLAKEAEFINTTLRYQLRILRARSRQAAKNNPFARRFFQMVVDNVCGPTPFRLQSKVRYKNGKLDDGANKLIEAAWCSWGRKGNCDLSGRWSWNAVQRLIVRSLAVDGELLLRIYRGAEYGKHGFMLQPVDVDRLDDLKNEALRGGGAIASGVEVDPYGKPVAYHILKRKPRDWMHGYVRDSERVPAEDVVHVFVPEEAEQVRGVPWIYAALLQLIHLGAFEEAAVIAARVGAAQMGVIQSPDGGETLSFDGTDEKGNPQIEAEPGTFPILPPGYEMNSWHPKYPDAAIEPFVKACLRGIAAGVNVAYHNLSGDMEGVNYSSARIAELDERDGWMTVQNFVCEHLHQPLFDAWMPMQLATGNLPFAYDQRDKYTSVYWQGRRWQWVDPFKEVQAAIAANDARLKSKTRIIAEGGDDIEDVFDEIASEEKLAKEKGVTLPASDAKPGKPANDEEVNDEKPEQS